MDCNNCIIWSNRLSMVMYHAGLIGIGILIGFLIGLKDKGSDKDE